MASASLAIPGKTPQSFDPACFDHDLDCKEDMKVALSDFEEKTLSKETYINVISVSKNDSDKLDIESSFKDEKQTLDHLRHQNNTNSLEIYGIACVLPSQQKVRDNDDEFRRLKISIPVFRDLMFIRQIPRVFFVALAQPEQVCGTGFRRLSSDVWDYWCMLPVRFRIDCRDANIHAASRAGKNQMDPVYYIHLSGVESDIRGSHVGIFVRGDSRTGNITFVVVSLLDQRFWLVAQEPLKQITGSLTQKTPKYLEKSPCFVLLIYLASALRWWNSVLLCFNKQLIKHEEILQKEIADEKSNFLNTSKGLSLPLHIMAAHLHRYKTELQRTEFILSDLLTHRPDMMTSNGPSGGDDALGSSISLSIDREREKLEQLASKLKVISSFSNEIERKLQNILALLFNQIQAINDKALQDILSAAQRDAQISQEISKQSHLLTISMKRDSIAMKTAMFAMPFFSQTKYLTASSQVWIWVMLTVISTIIAFIGFNYVIKRGEGSVDPELDYDLTEKQNETRSSQLLP
ncbi:hypothetical protein B7494_g3948 [Chlorociboria aeruginascens]|nr:hypothetical protein B7494_g3948 [Chlorociboria aeruginascens]